MIRISLVASIALLACAHIASAQCSVTHIVADDAQYLDRFGYSVDLIGDVAAIGAIGVGPIGQPPRGAGYVFERLGGVWTQALKIESPTDLEVGWGAAAASDVAAFGSIRATVSGIAYAGAVHLAERSAGSWAQTARLTASDPAPVAHFGGTTTICGNTMLISAVSKWVAGLERAGVVYVFERVAGAWTETGMLQASDPSAFDRFGISVALDGDTALIGAFGPSTTSPGKAYVFERVGGVWVETQILESPGSVKLGESVALSGDVALLGGDDHVFFWERVGGSWTQVAQFSPGSLANTVAVSGDLALAGNRGDSQAYVYQRFPAGWQEIDVWTWTIPGHWNRFGHSVALFGARALIGAPEDYVGNGSAWLIDLDSSFGSSVCIANPNSIGVAGSLVASGNPELTLGCFELAATQLPPNRFGYFLMAQTQAFVPLFGGSQGNLCLGLPIVRFSGDILNTGGSGSVSLAPDLANLPQGTVFQPGDTWNFQMWFRDINPGLTSNTTNGIAVTFATDGDPASQFPVTLLEIEEDTTLFEVEVTLSQPTYQDVVIPYTTSGTATYNVDWRVEETNPIVIPAGHTSFELTLVVAEDMAQEADETAIITLRPPTGGVLGTAPEFTLTILDDD